MSGGDKKKKARKKARASKRRFDYFDALEQLSLFAISESELLCDLVQNSGPISFDATRQARVIESASDSIVDKVIVAADDDFVTPIDRADLVEMSVAIDNMTDELERVVRYLYMHDVTSMEPAAARMCALLRDECAVVYKTVKNLRNPKKRKKLKERVRAIDEREDEIDGLYLQAVHELFASDAQPSHLMKWQAVYRTIEECSDSIKRAADLMLRVAVTDM